MTISVVVADDQAMLRTGFRLILGEEADIEVVADAADGREAVEVCNRLRPDVVLMDIRMPRLDGIAATKELAATGCPTKVLILTTFDADDLVYGALRAGASGYLLKDAPADQLIHAIRVLADGGALLAPELTRRLIAQFAAQPPAALPSGRLDALTDREREVLVLMAKGRSNTEIARDLVVSEATVKTHISRLFDKLEVRDRAQAVIAAYETGLVSPGQA
ncbi:MAG: response regulator receiver protein [Frankiales bacterium]|nr:response regulator receiver protein [Frankiales bacterium]